MKNNANGVLEKPWGFSILLIVLGAILVIKPGAMMTSFVRLVGTAGLAYGLYSLFISKKRAVWSTLDTGAAILLALAGLFLLISPQTIINILPTAGGIMIILTGAYNTLKALDARQYKVDKSWQMSLLLAAVTVVLGIVILTHRFGTMELLVRILGGVLIYNGLSSLWMLIKQ